MSIIFVILFEKAFQQIDNAKFNASDKQFYDIICIGHVFNFYVHRSIDSAVENLQMKFSHGILPGARKSTNVINSGGICAPVAHFRCQVAAIRRYLNMPIKTVIHKRDSKRTKCYDFKTIQRQLPNA